MKKNLTVIVFMLIIVQAYAQSTPTQGYSYSKQPLSVMGFTKTSTMSQVKKQLEDWGIRWNVSEARKNTIQIRDIRYEGCLFSVINFAFDSKGKILGIDFLPDDSEADDNIYNCFSSICKNLPYRKMYTRYTYYSPVNYYVFNGCDDTEFAIFTDYDEFGFCFNGSISDRYGIYP